ncbi:hypothetical protein ABIA39_001306 [Nocardia sp. GAS34]
MTGRDGVPLGRPALALLLIDLIRRIAAGDIASLRRRKDLV